MYPQLSNFEDRSVLGQGRKTRQTDPTRLASLRWMNEEKLIPDAPSFSIRKWPNQSTLGTINTGGISERNMYKCGFE